MSNSSNSTINSSVNPSKKCWNVGSNTVVVIDKSIIKKLGINESNTYFEEEITKDGILLRIRNL